MERVKSFIEVWKASKDIESFFSSLESLRIVHPLKFSVTAIFSSEDPYSILSSSKFNDTQVSLSESKNGSALFKLATQLGRIEHKSIEDVFILLKTDFRQIYTIITLSTNEFWERGLFRYLHKLRPRIVIPHLTQKEMKEILKTLQKDIMPDAIQIKRASLRSWIVSEGPSGKYKKLGSYVAWKEIMLDEILMEAKEEEKWFQSIVFEILRIKNERFFHTGFHTKVSTSGFLQTDYWYSSFRTLLLEPLISILKKKIELFSKRSREETPQHTPRPLIIYFEEEIFREKQMNEKFIHTLKKLPNSGYSLIHCNPYIHLSLVDYLDGSSHEVLVLEQDRILIIPQIKATESSIARVINHISEKFREGIVKDYSEAPIGRANTETP